jgi:hypothetical protein
MTVLQKLEAISTAIQDILTNSPLVQVELTSLSLFLDTV